MECIFRCFDYNRSSVHHYGIVIAKTRKDIIKAVQIIQTDLAESGFIVSVVKSNLIPSHKISWLGFQLDSVRNVL